ncbi:MAG: amino acid adenylation domain-containing protein [Pyrinomonadaceae bacterium]
MIESTYKLSPAQQGMLFHSMAALHTGVYLQQLRCGLHEDLHVPAFVRAWERVAERHAVLRTGFRWDGADGPRQEVQRTIVLPFEQHDWRDLSAGAQESGLETYLREDRQRAFEFGEAPLMRFALFRMAEDDYRLVWTSHHALLDGRSRLIVLKEVFAFYEAFCSGRDLTLAEPRSYSDFIGWLEQQDWRKAEESWRRRLKGFVAPTPLVVAAATTHEPSEPRVGEESTRLSAGLTSALHSFAQKHGLTLNTILQGAWALLLSRYSDETDIVFGTTRAGRRATVDGAEAMVGLFINTLPVRAEMSPERSLLSLLQELRAQSVALREYEHTPLLKIREWSDLPAGSPMFESIVVFENYHLNSTLRAQGGAWRNREFELLEQSNYPLAVVAYGGAELLLKLAYQQHRFEQPTVARMLRHLETTLGVIIDDPLLPIAQVSFMSAAERRQVLHDWNQTQADYPRDACIHQLFEAQVERTPASVAVVFEGEEVSYGELNERANGLARRLRRRGVGPDVPVGLLLERSAQAIVALLAILKAGGAYLPLDPSYPPERLCFMLKDAGAHLLLTRGELLGAVEADGVEVLLVDSEGGAMMRCGEEEEVREEGMEVRVAPANLAYVIYTSGSTGRPKGVMVEHRQLFNYVRGISQRMGFEAGAHFALVSTFAADLGHTMLFPSLCYGGTLHLISSLRAMDAAALGEYFRRQRIDYLKIVPSHLRAMLAASPERAHVIPRRRLILGGEAAGRELAAEVKKLNPECFITNHYGPTETTVGVLTHTVEPGPERTQASPTQNVPLGRPLPGSEVYVLDSHLQPVPVGAAGELYIGGDGLARGYFNSPGLTAERFIPHPFGAEPGQRLYRTGDLACYLPDGKVEFLGRRDQQVKIRAFRVELGEIESVLAAHEEVREAAVVAREDKAGEKRLVAYVVGRKGASLDADKLRRHVHRQLPGYMVPSAFVLLERLPRMAHGKLDRTALPAPESFEKRDGDGSARPRTSTEEVIAKIFSEALGVERVGVEENFFELGGHSLLATLVVSRIRELLMIELPLRDLFESPTVLQLSEAITARDPQPGRTETIARLLLRIQRMPADDLR